MLKNALTLATKLHEGQIRKSGEPYITHPLAVSEILKKHGFSEEIQTAGILHDLCEDTEINNMEIAEMFTQNIAFVLYALSKNNKNKDKTADKEHNFRMSMYVRRFASCASQNPIVMYVKMADQIHNLSTMQAFTVEKKLRKIKEVNSYFLPLYKQEEIIPKEDFEKYKSLLNHLERVMKSL